MEKDEQLETNKIDLLASAAKSVVGVVPFAGSLLTELVDHIIPNQRFDRLTKYVKELDKRLSKISIEKISQLKGNEDFIDLIEEGFVQASRAITDERRKYIASIIYNGMNDEYIELQESKFLLKILQELSDIEIIWLISFVPKTSEDHSRFREIHENVITSFPIYKGVSGDIIDKSAIQNGFKEHLHRLNLIEFKYKIDRNSKMPEFDRWSGRPKLQGGEITQLGKLFLKQIGQTDYL